MVLPFRSSHFNKSFSTTTNRNKHERAKGHGPKDNTRSIPFDTAKRVYMCPTDNCTTSSKYKHNILKHLKSCDSIRKRKIQHASNKTCKFCGKEFVKKSNRQRHELQFHITENNSESEEVEN